MGNEVSKYEGLAPSVEEIQEAYSKFGECLDPVAENDPTTFLALRYLWEITRVNFLYLLEHQEKELKSLAEDFRAYVEDEVGEQTEFQSDELRRRLEGRLNESKRRLDRHLEMITNLQDRIVPGEEL